MNERYTKLFSLSNPLYAVGAPVIISAGALSKDNLSGQPLIQLKLQNINMLFIKAAKVSFHLFDSAGRPLGTIEQQYLDLNVPRDSFWGDNIPVIIKDPAVRSFTPAVTEIVFKNNSIWNGDANEEWQPLSAPVTLQRHFSANLAEQYCIQYGKNCVFFPEVQQDIWYCTCGAVNHADETCCHLCKRSLQNLLDVDVDALKQACNARLEEQRQKEEQAQAAAAAKTKKAVTIAAVIITAIVVLAVAIFLIVKGTTKSRLYKQATAMAEAGNYADAADAFSELGTYKDSAEQYQTICKQELPYRLIYNYVQENGEPVSDVTLSDNITISSGYCLQFDLSSTYETPIDEDLLSLFYFYVDTENPDELIFMLHQPFISSDGSTGVEYAEYTYQLTKEQAYGYIALNQGKSENAPEVVLLTTHFDASSYSAGSSTPIDSVQLDGQYNPDPMLTNAYQSYIGQWNDLVFRCVNASLDYLKIDLQVTDLGYSCTQ